MKDFFECPNDTALRCIFPPCWNPYLSYLSFITPLLPRPTDLAGTCGVTMDNNPVVTFPTRGTWDNTARAISHRRPWHARSHRSPPWSPPWSHLPHDTRGGEVAGCFYVFDLAHLRNLTEAITPILCQISIGRSSGLSVVTSSWRVPVLSLLFRIYIFSGLRASNILALYAVVTS